MLFNFSLKYFSPTLFFSINIFQLKLEICELLQVGLNTKDSVSFVAGELLQVGLNTKILCLSLLVNYCR